MKKNVFKKTAEGIKNAGKKTVEFVKDHPEIAAMAVTFVTVTFAGIAAKEAYKRGVRKGIMDTTNAFDKVGVTDGYLICQQDTPNGCIYRVTHGHSADGTVIRMPTMFNSIVGCSREHDEDSDTSFNVENYLNSGVNVSAEPAANADGGQVAQPGKPAHIDRCRAAGRNAQQKNQRPQSKARGLLGHHQGNKPKQQPQEPRKHPEGEQVFLALMRAVHQQGERDLQQRRRLGDAVEQAEGKVARLQLVRQADHGRCAAAADDAVQVAKQIAQQNQAQAAPNGLGQFRFII